MRSFVDEAGSSMSQWRLVWVVCGLALGVVALCFAISGDLLAASIVATRYSARFSGLILALALVARSPWRLLEHKAQMALAFVAAHTVHYATVIGRAIIEPSNPLRHLAGENVVVVGGGVVLIALIGITAMSTSRVVARTNAIAFYVAWGTLAIASASRFRTSIPSVVVLTALVLAMLCRIGLALRHSRSRTSSGGV